MKRPTKVKIVFIVAMTGWMALRPSIARADASTAPPLRETIEWIDYGNPQANKSDLSRVLRIGDSITRGYYDVVASEFKGKAVVVQLATSH